VDKKPSGTWAPLPTDTASKSWKQASADKDLSSPINYDPKRSFSLGDVIIHKKYGIGIVMGVKKESNTLIVVFKQHTKKLVHKKLSTLE
jgi:transcription elongation factor GreA-like protein